MIAVALATGVLASTQLPAALLPETSQGYDAAFGRIEVVEHIAGKEALAWTPDPRPVRLLVQRPGGHAFIERRLARAVDAIEFHYTVATPDYPGASEAVAHAVWLPGGGLPELGAVESIRPPKIRLGEEFSLRLRHARIHAAGLAQRCRANREGRTWCAIAIATKGAVRILYFDDIAGNGRGGWDFIALAFAGDLNRDGRVDLIFDWGSRGGASCSATDLFLSQRLEGQWRWPAAKSETAFCD